MIFSEGCKQTPHISFDSEAKILTVSGNSFPEDANVIFSSVIEWVNKLDCKNLQEITIHVALKYYNTASSKKLFELIKSVNDIFSEECKAEVIWEYFSDDEDMLESGRYYSELVDIPFRFVEITD